MTISALESVSLWLAGDTGEAVLPLEELAGRQDVFTMTRQAQDAVLLPADTGAWPHPLRAALAARIAVSNGNPYLAAIYNKSASHSSYAEIAQAGFIPSDAVQQKIVAFMDRVANDTKAVSADDVTNLQQAGIADADIVRLCELNAFLAYQIRVAAGLASLVETDGEQG